MDPDDLVVDTQDPAIEQPPVVGLDRELLRKHREQLAEQQQSVETPIPPQHTQKSHISEMGLQIINMFNGTGRPHPHSVGYLAKLRDYLERMRTLNPDEARPRTTSQELFGENRAQYVYSTRAEPGSAPIVEMKSRDERDRIDKTKNLLVLHIPDTSLLEKIRAAEERLKSRKKKWRGDGVVRMGTMEDRQREPVSIQDDDDDFDIFAGLELSEGKSKGSLDDRQGPLFDDHSADDGSHMEQNIDAIRERLARGAQIREDTRREVEASSQKRKLVISEDDVLQTDGPSFGEKLSVDMFGRADEDSQSKRKNKKGTKKRPEQS